MKRALAAFSLALALCTASEAQANGRFPSAGHVEVDPADPAHIVLRATYGVLESRDSGETFHWICEESMHFAGIWDPPISITKGGALLVGLPDGLSVSTPDACGFERANALEGKFIADLAASKSNPARAVVLASTPKGALFETAVFKTEDGGATFSPVEYVFPDNLRGTTIELAPSDPAILYVSGVLEGALPTGVVFASKDGGKTFSNTPVPSSDSAHAPFLGAVDPENPARVYVRLDATPGRLLVSEDAASSFEEIFTGVGPLLGFALSPDGKTLLVGGEKDGVWRSPAPTWAFEQSSRLHARCLRWAESGIYACTEEALDGFSVGFSVTEGSTFRAFSRLADLCGPPACPATSPTAMECEPRWPIVRTTLNAKSCEIAPIPDAGINDRPPRDDPPAAGCNCRFSSASGASAKAAPLLLLFAALRRRKPRRAP